IKDMKGYFPGNEGFFSERVQSYLNRLSKYDKKSDVFRYPFGTKGNWLLSGQPIMPMEEIKKMVREISHELNSIAVQLIENLNLLHESKLTNPE
ncbi:MAG: hypothetical protein KKF80_06930, partial [Candidatus Omnitrophica bacterium]|nr:hypothetical protein [Candidatus Omnitrophota bacterium]